MRLAKLLLIFSVLSILTFAATAQGFKCNTPHAVCKSIIDYVTPNATTLNNIRILFGVKNLRTLLGANSMPVTALSNQSVAANTTIRIPFPCICSNGTGISNNRPIYTVQPGDSLDHIARDVFKELTTYQKIAAVNNIPDPNLIEIGQNLSIPLPCSCDAVDGDQVVHYGHVVTPGSSVSQIAEEYGTTQQTLLTLNSLASPDDLLAGAVLDVPLKVCTTNISNTSLDYPLLVPNGTYIFTANNCIQCTCNSSTSLKLQCEPSPMEFKIPNWSQCPAMQCATNNLSIGSTLPSTGCERTTCTYTGYNNQTILTTLVSDSTCTGGAPSAQPSDNYATKIGLQGSSWRWLVIFVLLCFGLLL